MAGILKLGVVHSEIKTSAEAIFEESDTTAVLFPGLTDKVVINERQTDIDQLISIGIGASLYPPTDLKTPFKKGETFILISRNNGKTYQTSIDIGIRMYF